MKTNKIELLVLDWAGTVLDFGSFAPTTIFVEAFKTEYDFDISLAEARVPMGLSKIDHIRSVGQLPEVKQRWIERFGQAMNEEQAQAIYQTFMPLQIAKVADHAELIPGTLETIKWARDNGIKIGSCSGYPQVVMDKLIPVAAANGYQPDCIVASDNLAAGARPGPFMALENVIKLGVSNVSHCVKIDDSAPGISEGLNAGMWTVGLTLSGNEAGLTRQQFEQASSEELAAARELAKGKLEQAGSHYLIDTIADLPSVLEDIDRRLSNGEKP
ncbi:phosphonoacetaldehyde hydrolase [Sinobacterium caligoides]|uniref:Phosphonoacetaldehyde hydrolase n=1 Tax=Sinobacterium caligoides TaxID=933926 RepID=A0A3N2E1A7_9GAMM|nr:phosphonoacetaldehyde hydrolase [Sinobacterium caligoides]ROS05429.1 phosphonoacetaldehyde hydrolase [Sinobacterium caligoides]